MKKSRAVAEAQHTQVPHEGCTQGETHKGSYRDGWGPQPQNQRGFCSPVCTCARFAGSYRHMDRNACVAEGQPLCQRIWRCVALKSRVICVLLSSRGLGSSVGLTDTAYLVWVLY
eukprot:403844-Pelagomonas_calceolata.AAC.1